MKSSDSKKEEGKEIKKEQSKKAGELKTDFPLSEKDEVKKAETRMNPDKKQT
ncbi:hypothetical protein ACFQZX_06620 [Mucilaginibacter litoreus]|uniref:Uncharacterized protein n=1 Tax=Mucilaginibacter litoreus TaxID=1048221 RepID=A0ABW3AQP7_9SPHI